MSSSLKLPLSQNPIDAAALSAILNRYDGRNPMALVRDFEKSIADGFGNVHVAGLSSGTAAIHLALKALDVLPGDRVIAPTFTYVASVSPILYLGAVPVLVDCAADDWNMDPVLLRQAIIESIAVGHHPKAVIVVHTYGMPARMNEILAITREFGIPVLEDAAEAIGSTYEGRPLGTLADLGVLSFNNNKILTTYGGGAVLTQDAAVAERILYWATHARHNKPYYEHDEEGYNYRMSPMSAAAGLAGLALLSKHLARRRATFDDYRRYLGQMPGTGWQEEPNGSRSNRWFSCLTRPEGTEKIREALLAQGIESRPLWKPMHRQPLFADCHSALNGTSDRLFATGICLPSGNELTSETVAGVAKIVADAIAGGAD